MEHLCCGWNPFIFLLGLMAITSSSSGFIQISSFAASEFWIWMSSLPYCFPDSAVFPYALMFHCHWCQSEPIHLHWPVFCCILPSPGPHEDRTCFVPWVSLLWQGGRESSGSRRDGPRCSWNDLVWECVSKAWWQRAAQCPAGEVRKSQGKFRRKGWFRGIVLLSHWSWDEK